MFKLISLQVLALGEAWTLEQRLQSDSFSSSNVQIVQQERWEAGCHDVRLDIRIF